MKIKQVESMNHMFVDQLKGLLDTTFESTNANHFTIGYFLGKDQYGIKYLCFEIISKITGLVYGKSFELKSFEVPADREEEFFNTIIGDLVLGGVTFFYTELAKKKTPPKNHFQDMMKIEITLN